MRLSLPEHYLPRKFALKSDRSEAFDVLFSPESKEYSLDKILEEVVKNNELRKFVIFSTAQNGKTTELYRLYNIISKDVERVFNLLRHLLIINFIMIVSLIFCHVD